MNSDIDIDNYLYLADIFEKLRKGYHITAADRKIYYALDGDFERYKNIFFQLGFELILHSQHFFYFKGDNRLGEQARQISVFMYILIEWLSDNNVEIEDSLAQQKWYNLRELPHLQQERYKEYLKQVKINDLDDLKGILKRMEKLGFIDLTSEQSFQFRTAVYRFLDICQEILKESSENE